jgi:ATP-dependent Clp protease protease subunit
MKKLLLVLMFLTSTCFAKDIVLTRDNTATLRGPVDGTSVADVMSQLSELNKVGGENDPIYLILQTPGGSVFAGLQLIEYMNSLRRPVHSVANFAASMGFHILENSKKRYITKYGTIMSHRASGGFDGDIPQQVNSRFKHIVDLIEKMDDQVISRTNGKYTRASYMELIRDEYWAVGSNTITDGFVDEVASLKCDSSLEGTTEKIFNTVFGPVSVVFSNCPLITQPLKVSGVGSEEVGKILNTVRKLEL